MRPLRPGEPLAIGPYRLVGVIGSGGMGRVFLGIAPDGRLAAVKQVLAGIADDPGFRSRFAREVDASRRVSGAYTAPVLAADPAAGTPWLASLYVPGPSLQQAVDSYGPLPDPALRRLAVGLASALAEIHRAGLIHRDLKPGNVLLTDDGPRVIDFGVAHVLHDAAPLTRTGAVVGSPGFMAPEQLDDRTVTPATDVFALGAVLALAAGGVAPFGRGTPQAMLYRVLIGDPDLFAVAPPLRPLLAACMAKEPEQRPTVEHLLTAFGRLEPTRAWLPPALHHDVAARTDAARHLAGLAGGPPPVSVDPAGRAPAPAAGRPRGRVVVAAVAALVVAAATTTVVLLTRGDGADTGSGALPRGEAAALVTAVLPDPTRPPPGFRLNDFPATPEVDGAPTDPLTIDRSHTYFACEVQDDPPTPAEAGIVALSRLAFDEDVALPPDRHRDVRTVSVSYLDPAARPQIMREIRERIGGCRAPVPPSFTAWRFSGNRITGADENVGFVANLPPDPGLPGRRPQVAACEIARVGALVIRGCALVSDTSARAGPGTEVSQDDALLTINRETVEPIVARARALQAPD